MIDRFLTYVGLAIFSLILILAAFGIAFFDLRLFIDTVHAVRAHAWADAGGLALLFVMMFMLLVTHVNFIRFLCLK